MSLKLERLNSNFQKEISEIIATDVDDVAIKNNLVAISDVDITSDYSFAKVYFTILKEEYKEDVIKALNNASGFIEHVLFKRVDIAKMPKLQFLYDDSVKEGEKIEQIIKELN